MSAKAIRNPSQVVIGLAIDKSLLALVDAAIPALGETRSSFVRKAVAMRLREIGVVAGDVIISAPSRAGKGGRKPPLAQHLPPRQREAA